MRFTLADGAETSYGPFLREGMGIVGLSEAEGPSARAQMRQNPVILSQGTQ